MPTFLRGWDGKATQGTGDTTIVAISSWEVTVDQAIEELGPYLADAGTTYTSRGALTCKWSFKGVVPSGGDASQTAVIAALSAGTDIKLTFVSTGAGSVVITTATVEQVKKGHDAKSGSSIEASGRNNGSFTIA
jgi:hypothetical protein